MKPRLQGIQLFCSDNEDLNNLYCKSNPKNIEHIRNIGNIVKMGGFEPEILFYAHCIFLSKGSLSTKPYSFRRMM